MQKTAIRLLPYGLVFSALIGALASAFLVAVTGASRWLWTGRTGWQTILIVMGGTGLLVWLLRRWPDMPQTAQTAWAAVKARQPLPLARVGQTLLVSLVILSLGAGVAPGTALISVVVTLSVWQAAKLRYLYCNQAVWRTLPWTTRVVRLVAPHRYLIPYEPDRFTSRKTVWQKRLLVTTLIGNGALVFWIFLHHTDQASFLTQLGTSHWRLSELVMVVPVLAGALILGHGYQWLNQSCQRLLQRTHLTRSWRVILGGGVIAAVAWWAPRLLFSGQRSLHLLVGAWQHASPQFLATMAIAKLLFLLACLRLNWRGGVIFPVLFASLTLGFAVAGWLPQVDTLLVVALTATSLSGVLLRKPAIAGAVVALFFPLNMLPAIGINVALMWGIFRLSND